MEERVDWILITIPNHFYLSFKLKMKTGRIDPKAVEICAAINTRDEYYTTSSCAGRCFLYVGDGRFYFYF